MNKKFTKDMYALFTYGCSIMQLSFDLGGMSLNRIYADGADNEIIRNGDFSGGSSQWLLFVDWAANASAYNIVTADTEGNSISRTGCNASGGL